MCPVRLAGGVAARLLRRLAGALLLLCLASRVWAHDAPPSLLLLDIGDRVVNAEFQLPANDLGAAMGLSPAILGRSQLDRDAVARYVMARFDIRSPDGRRFDGAVRSVGARMTHNTEWTGNAWVVVRAAFRAPAGASTERMTLASTLIVHRVLSHQTLVYVRTDLRNELVGDKPVQVGVFAFGTAQIALDGTEGSWWKGAYRMFSMGMRHIIEGPDHLLFILALLLSAPLLARRGRWDGLKTPAATARDILGVVTGFTVGHSATLALAALGVVAAPARAVEVLIAVSILVASLHAWRPLFARRDAWIATGFGLVHGLAFADVLTNLNVDTRTLVTSLLSFNLGIEAMQLVVIAAVLPTMLLIETRSGFGTPFRLALATCGGACALGWIAQRALGWPNPLEAVVDRLAPPPLVLLVGAGIAGILSLAVLGREGRERRIGGAGNGP